MDTNSISEFTFSSLPVILSECTFTMKELQGEIFTNNFILNYYSDVFFLNVTCRFATVKYSKPNDQNVDVVFMHLTNYSLNKFSQSYVPEPEGSKR